MKKMRLEDRSADSELIRRSPSSLPASRVESYGQLHNNGTGGGGEKNRTADAAAQFLKEVQDTFRHQREKFDQYLQIMKDIKLQSNPDGFIARLEELFEGHNNLIYGLNAFLPDGYKITFDVSEGPQITYEEALNFVKKIKRRFGSDDHAYKTFLDLLHMYKEHENTKEAYDEISLLFEDHPDLLDELSRFCPVKSPAVAGHHSRHSRKAFQPYVERSSRIPPSPQKHIGEQPWLHERVSASHAAQDLTVKHLGIDKDDATMIIQKDLKKRENGSHVRRGGDQDDGNTDNDMNRDSNIRPLPDKIKPFSNDLVFPSVSTEDEGALKRVYNREFIFYEKVKEGLNNLDDYHAFLKCLHLYSNEIMTRDELQNVVADLLGKHQDLVEGFNEFLTHCQKDDGFLVALRSIRKKKSLLNDGHLPSTTAVDDKDPDAKTDVEGAKEKDKDKERYIDKSIQDLDLSKCESCTPSYRRLPDDYPIATSSHGSTIDAKVLNDYWISITSGSEDYYSKHNRRNKYEKTLFRCEDDRFELDMLIELAKSTVNKVKDLLKGLNNDVVNADSPNFIEGHFTASNLRCIEQVYGVHGLDVMDILRQDPAVALPIILTRLKQKKEEWTKSRSDFNKIWAQVYKDNHDKSLDHRGFYFKLLDSKKLSIKYLESEIKERKQNHQNQDVALLVLEYCDADIHQDLYELVKFSARLLCSSDEKVKKILRLWTTFLEPLLAVPPRLHSTESDGADDVGERHVSHSVEADDVGERDVSPGMEADDVNSMQLKVAVNTNDCTVMDVVVELNVGDMDKIKSDDVTTENVPEVISFISSPHVGSESSPGGNGEERRSGSKSAGDDCSREKNKGDDDLESDELDSDGESESEADGCTDADYNGGDGNQLSQTGGDLLTLMHLSKYAPSATQSSNSKVSRALYGNDNFYVLFRLHHKLYERILEAKLKSISSTEPRVNEDQDPLCPYTSFMSALYYLLDGVYDHSEFEDECRAIIGIESYVLFTLDKLINKLVKQLLKIVADETSSKLLRLFENEKSREPGEVADSVYLENARAFLHDENIYHIESSSSPTRLLIQLMDSGHEEPEVVGTVSEDPMTSAQ